MKTLFSTNLATPSKKRSLAFLLSGLTLSLSLEVSAVDLSAQKLFGKWNQTTNPANYEMGNGHGTLAVSEKWIVVGTPLADEGAQDQGSVQVFNAVTGLWVRKLTYPVATANNIRLGQSCSISGDVIAVGAPDFSNATTGSVFVFNATSGKIITTIILPTDIGENGAPGDRFGSSMAIFGTRLLIGSPADDAGKGSAYIYDYTKSEIAPIKLTDISGLAADGFGTSVAVEGNIGIVGSPNMSDGLTVKTGGFLAFDMTTGALLKRFTPTGAGAGDTAGSAVALAKGLVIMSATTAASPTTGKVVTYNLMTGAETTLAPSDSAVGDLFGSSISSSQSGLIMIGASGKNANQGAAYVFDLNSNSTTELMKIPALQNTVQAFGSSVALLGETAIIAASKDSTAGPNVGSVYLIKPITSQMPLKKVVAKGDFAPGAESTLFNAFSDVYINADSEMVFTSTLTGPGSNAGKDTGVWSTLTPSGLELLNKGRNSFANGVGTINVVTKALLNEPGRAIYQASLLPTGASIAVSPINNQSIFFGLGTSDFFRTGTTIATFETPVGANPPDGAVPLGFAQVVQSRSANLLSVTCTLRPNVNGTTATNDSGLFSSNFVAPIETKREGFAAFSSGPILGQFTGRVVQHDALTVFATAVAGGAPKTADQAIFAKTFGGPTTLISQKGQAVNNAEGTPIPGAAFASYIAESADVTQVLYRASIAGTPASAVPAAQNEGLWLHNGVTTRQILRKGVDLGIATPSYIPAVGLSGVRIAKFISFWQTNGQQLAFVQLAGIGVTAANDQALLLMQSNPANQLLVLIREGQIAPNCGNATIGVINRIEVEPHRGTYLVLTTLVGAAKGTDLALFQGASSLPVTSTTDTLRRPYLVLRKGQLFDNQPSKVKSFSLPASNLTAGGAGATGLGKAIQEGTDPAVITESVIVVEFDNGVRQIMKGKL
jgi:hypothetical protein